MSVRVRAGCIYVPCPLTSCKSTRGKACPTPNPYERVTIKPKSSDVYCLIIGGEIRVRDPVRSGENRRVLDRALIGVEIRVRDPGQGRIEGC